MTMEIYHDVSAMATGNSTVTSGLVDVLEDFSFFIGCGIADDGTITSYQGSIWALTLLSG